jgi:hypothetical protein
MIKPQDTPNLLVSLIENVERPIVQQHMKDRMAHSLAIGAKIKNTDLEASPLTRGMTLEQASKKAAEVFVGAAIEDLSKSTLYYCDKDMSSLVEAGVRTLDASDIGDLSLIPCEIGFCYFSGGIQIDEYNIINGLSWRVVEDMYAATSGYNDFLATPDRHAINLKQNDRKHGTDLAASRWTFRQIMHYNNNDVLNPSTKMTSEQLAMAYESEAHIPEFVITQVFHSLLLMLQQGPQMIEKSKVTPKSSATIRRAKKHDASTEVVVVDIRRKRKSSKSSGEKSTIEYSVRWMVSGHWRWQWFKDEATGKRVQKRIWINPHLKGPDGKPFKKTKRVYALLK